MVVEVPIQLFGGYSLSAQLITVKNIEDTLQLGHTKTAELIKAGEITTLKIGRRRYSTPELLSKFIERKLKEQAA